MENGVHGPYAMEHGRNFRARHERARARSGATVGIIDSTFIESAYGGVDCAPNGYKRAVGNNLHVVIDKTSRVLSACVLPANKQDADGARILLPAVKAQNPTIRKVLGDKAYRQKPLKEFAAELDIDLDGDSPPLPKGTIFVPMPLRWRVERFFAWISKWRRIAKNWCFTPVGFALDVRWCILGLSLRRLA